MHKTFYITLGNGVETVATPRMTPDYAAHAEPKTLEGTMLPKGFNAVAGAGGSKPARGLSVRANEYLVSSYGQH